MEPETLYLMQTTSLIISEKLHLTKYIGIQLGSDHTTDDVVQLPEASVKDVFVTKQGQDNKVGWFDNIVEKYIEGTGLANHYSAEFH